MMRRRAFLALSLAAAAGAAVTGRAFSNDLDAARQRLAGRSRLVRTRFGQMEVAEAGDGPPVLMVHGTGGGFDQALAMAGPLLPLGWRLIAPSRIGYLRSDYPKGATPATEADGFAELLDALAIDRVPIIGGSAGAQPAIEFAIRHPDRCSALVALVPAAFAPGRPPVRPPTPLARAIIDHGLQSDFLFWAGMSVAQDAMIGALLATDPALVRAAAPAEQARARAILRDILPVSDRARGFGHDARFAGDPLPQALERITVPTLAISMEDDRFETAAAARHIAASVQRAELIIYPTGGHIWIGRQDALFAAVDDFLRRTAAAGPGDARG
ncbi:alpha/beta hydrolase [Sandarakinorhabdus sp. AAP62]|uniref:alpha/beta fold hydrolase n=1 Tax=Sandarakinorhabdus sp. AAP62 TaxID=1248916 RepID=UPI00187C3A64|nr:alpha/beta hydrolase [Sandarakinorhabdus sp. AAP62]